MGSPSCHGLLLFVVAAVLFSASFSDASAPPRLSEFINITGILDQAGGYTQFIHRMNRIQAAVEIDSPSEASVDGITVFAPTDEAFQDLPAGTLDTLVSEEQTRLVRYHVCPKFYTLQTLRTVRNPVRTLASGQENGVFGLDVFSDGDQVNVSSGFVNAAIRKVVREDFPLAVYQVDAVLLPVELYEAPTPAVSPSPSPLQIRRRRRGTSSVNTSDSAGKICTGLFLGVACMMIITASVY